MYVWGVDSKQRQERILDLLRRVERVDVVDLAAELATSEVTIRRDLDELSELGAARRVRGGAVSRILRGQELPFAVRVSQAGEAKTRIAAAAAGLVGDGEAVVVDSGTTGVAAAAALAGRPVTVIALSVPAAAAVWSSITTLIMPGGVSRPGEGALTGRATEQALAALRADTFLLTCCGVSVGGGITAFDQAEGAVKQAARHCARRTVLMADATKFGRSTLAVVGGWDSVDVLVTDADREIAEVRRFADAGVQVLHV